MKIIAKQLENLKRQREKDQVLLAGLEQRLTALKKWLPAVPPPRDSMGAVATHDATYQQLVQLPTSPERLQPGSVEVEKPQEGAEVVPSHPAVVHSATLLAAMEIQLRARVVQLGPVSTARKVAVALVAVPCTQPSPKPDTLRCLGLISQPNHMSICFLHPTRLPRQQKWTSVRFDTAGPELVKKYHVLLHSKREEVVFSTSQSWRYTSSMWGYLGGQPWPPPEQLEDELLVKGSVVLCVGI
jgi:hypothetical protein